MTNYYAIKSRKNILIEVYIDYGNFFVMLILITFDMFHVFREPPKISNPGVNLKFFSLLPPPISPENGKRQVGHFPEKKKL